MLITIIILAVIVLALVMCGIVLFNRLSLLKQLYESDAKATDSALSSLSNELTIVKKEFKELAERPVETVPPITEHTINGIPMAFDKKTSTIIIDGNLCAKGFITAGKIEKE